MTGIAEQIIKAWWESLPSQSRSRGSIAGGLVLLENLRDDFNLSIFAHKADHSDQLKNAGSVSVQKILGRFGERRILVKEGGRTNRGLMKALEPLLTGCEQLDPQNLSTEERTAALDTMQEFLVAKARNALNAQKITFEYKIPMVSREAILLILQSANIRKKAGDVAEYLVGAKLALRFPGQNIRNTSVNAPDDQTLDFGDFQINDSVFHVTMSPNRGHYDKCLANLNSGLRVFLLVPDIKLMGARQYVESDLQNRVAVESIESFVSQNMEELAEFSSKKIPTGLVDLLEKYNERVEEVEADLSLQIEIPAVLKRKKL